MNGLLELRLAGLLWSGQPMWFFRAVTDSLVLSVRIYVKSNEISGLWTLAGFVRRSYCYSHRSSITYLGCVS